MVCLGFEPWVAGWKAQTNPLSYGGTPQLTVLSFLQELFINFIGGLLFITCGALCIQYYENTNKYQVRFFLLLPIGQLMNT